MQILNNNFYRLKAKYYFLIFIFECKKKIIKNIYNLNEAIFDQDKINNLLGEKNN